MNPRLRAFLATVLLLVVLIWLIRLFPRAIAFTEMAARELRVFWWLILIVALGIWLVWGVGRRPKQ